MTGAHPAMPSDKDFLSLPRLLAPSPLPPTPYFFGPSFWRFHQLPLLQSFPLGLRPVSMETGLEDHVGNSAPWCHLPLRESLSTHLAIRINCPFNDHPKGISADTSRPCFLQSLSRLKMDPITLVLRMHSLHTHRPPCLCTGCVAHLQHSFLFSSKHTSAALPVTSSRKPCLLTTRSSSVPQPRSFCIRF